MRFLATIVPMLLYIAFHKFIPMSTKIVKIPHRGYILAFAYIQSCLSYRLLYGFKFQQWHDIGVIKNRLERLPDALYEIRTPIIKSCILQYGTNYASNYNYLRSLTKFMPTFCQYPQRDIFNYLNILM